MSNTLTINKTLVFHTWKSKTAAAVIAVAAAVALPQLFHALGAVSGLGSALGETFLPMHLPVLVIGLTAGPAAGLAAGVLSPVVSFGLSGMPSSVMLPFLLVELAGYGLAAGLLARVRLNTFCKLLLVQAAGRALRCAAVLIGVYAFDSTVAVSSIWMSIVTGLPGILLQWALIPLLMFWVEKGVRRHE